MAYDPDVADRLRELLAEQRGLTEKRMFGGLAFLINGHMAVSASGQGGLLLRVDPARTEDFIADPAATRAVMRGREMDGWLRVNTAQLRTDAEWRTWVDRAVGYISSLPPK